MASENLFYPCWHNFSSTLAFAHTSLKRRIFFPDLVGKLLLLYNFSCFLFFTLPGRFYNCLFIFFQHVFTYLSGLNQLIYLGNLLRRNKGLLVSFLSHRGIRFQKTYTGKTDGGYNSEVLLFHTFSLG
jgi:hypothetical protein